MSAFFLGLMGRFFSWKFIVFLYLPLLAIWWLAAGDGEKKIKEQGVMNVPVDSTTKLPIVDLDLGNPLGVQEFHAAVLEKDFLIRGVEVSVVIQELNSKRGIMKPLNSDARIFSDIVSLKCLPKLHQSYQSSEVKFEDLKNFVSSICGKAVYPMEEGSHNDYEVSALGVENLCKEPGTCAPCVIHKGSPLMGDCSVKNIVFRDETRYVNTAHAERVVFEIKPKFKLGYMRYPSQLRPQ